MRKNRALSRKLTGGAPNRGGGRQVHASWSGCAMCSFSLARSGCDGSAFSSLRPARVRHAGFTGCSAHREDGVFCQLRSDGLRSAGSSPRDRAPGVVRTKIGSLGRCPRRVFGCTRESTPGRITGCLSHEACIESCFDKIRPRLAGCEATCRADAGP